MMISMSRASQKRTKPRLRFDVQFAIKRRRPVLVRLLADRRDHYLNHSVELAQHVILGNTSVAELQRPLADISRPADLRSNVVVEVSGEVKNQIANAVAVRIRPRP